MTGAAGFIGSNVVRALLADGHEVRAVHLPGEDTRNLRGLPAERTAADVTDRAAMLPPKGHRREDALSYLRSMATKRAWP